MTVPTFEEFRTLARGGKLVPIYREVFADHDTPVSAFRKVAEGDYAFLLESVEGGEKWGRYSLLGSRPSKVFIARGQRCELHEGGRVTKLERHPIDELADLLRRHQAVALPGLPQLGFPAERANPRALSGFAASVQRGWIVSLRVPGAAGSTRKEAT